MNAHDLNDRLRGLDADDQDRRALLGVIAAAIAVAAGIDKQGVLAARERAERGCDTLAESYADALREGRLADVPEAIRTITPLG